MSASDLDGTGRPADPAVRQGRLTRLWRAVKARAGLIFGALVFGLALVALHHLLAEFQYREVMAHVRSLPWAALYGALALSALSYLTLAGYDLSALHYVGARVPFRTVLYASFTGYAISNNLGFTLLSGGSVRYRVYSAAGLPTPAVARIIVFCGLTFSFGICAVGSVGFLLQPDAVTRLLHLPAGAAQGIAVLLIAALVAVLVLPRLFPQGVRVGRWTLDLPSPALIVVQVLISSADILLTAGILFVLLPPHEVSFGAFIGVYCAALLAGLLSHVPGGVGVFESIVLLGLSGSAPTSGVLGALLAYRAIYYLLPLVLATLLLAAGELAEHGGRAARLFGRMADRVAPTATATLVFIAGVVLLISGATPADYGRLVTLNAVLPLPAIELAHLLASLVGLGLLLLARGLYRRMDAAWRLSVALLGAAVVLSLAKGLVFEAAALAGLALVALLPGRTAFYRRTRLSDLRFSRGWMLAVIGAVAVAIWLALFSYEDVDYSNDLWWRFRLAADAPRSLRAMLAVVAAVAGVSAFQLLRPAVPRPRPATPEEIDRARRILARWGATDDPLAIRGDLSLLFSETGEGVLAYGVRGLNWIALADPVGAPVEQAELIWRFRELCDRNGARPVFHGVGAATLPLYLEIGLVPVRLDGRVPFNATDRADGEVHYLVCPAGLSHDQVLADVAALSGRCRQAADVPLAKASS